MAVRDLLSECLASLLARPARAILTVIGTVVGVAALVATLGLSKTAGNQIVGRFDELAATDIVVTPKTGTTGRAQRTDALPWDAEQRARRLNGVVSAGTLTDVDLKGQLVRAVPVNDPQGQTQFQMPVKAASPGLFEAELQYLHRHEWARTADDVLWRRTKLGLHLHASERVAVAHWCAAHWPAVAAQADAGQLPIEEKAWS